MIPADVTVFDAADHRWMARALRLATRGRTTTRANPQVGCVIVRNGVLVAEGWHVRPGEPHAEANALAHAGEGARGATAYVTLEPCAHHGRTPPCADALIRAGVARVVVANVDPNPQVGGAGIDRLRAAGIECQSGLLAAPAARLNRAFMRRQVNGRPWVRIKLAASADARTALPSGESAWVTGAAARLDVQRWRARACAILTGADTVLADDPSLTVRVRRDGTPCAADATDLAQPLRVIIDGRGRIPPHARTVQCPGDVLVLTTPASPRNWREALGAHGAEVVVVDTTTVQVPLQAALEMLAERDLDEVHTECGPRLAGALTEAGLVDELLLYSAAHLLGHSARPLLELTAPLAMSGRRALQVTDMRRVGADLRVIYTPQVAQEQREIC